MGKTHFTKWDLIPIAAVLLAAALVLWLFLPGSEAAQRVEIYKNGQLVESLPLSRDAVYCVEGVYTNEITIRDGKVAITRSSCPGGDCKACGWLSAGGSIVCLPNGVEVRLIAGSGDVDIIVG